MPGPSSMPDSPDQPMTLDEATSAIAAVEESQRRTGVALTKALESGNEDSVEELSEFFLFKAEVLGQLQRLVQQDLPLKVKSR